MAEMGETAIILSSGWWKTRKKQNRYDKKAHGALVVSIRTKDVRHEVNLYAEVENLIRNVVEANAKITIQ